MKSKKAILMPETLKIIMAIMGIVLLLYLGISLSGIFLKRTSIQQAEAVLEDLSFLMENLEEGAQEDYLVLSPQKWFLVYYDAEVVERDPKKHMPLQCNGENCLCACPSRSGLEALGMMTPLRMERGGYPDYFYYRDEGGLDGVVKCEKEGACRPIHKLKLKLNERIHFYRIWSGAGHNEVAGYVNWISLFDVPRKIILKNEWGVIKVSDFYSEPKFIDGLLYKVITFRGEKLSFEEFATQHLANFCEGENFEISSDAREKANEVMSEYLTELEKDKQITHGYMHARRLVLDRKIDDISASLSWTKLSSSRWERKKLCEKGGVVFHMELVVKNE